jgi:hypothetical protein
MVRDLRASVTWNRFGTPGSLIRYGRHLAYGVEGKTAVAAARNWLAANRGLFRLRSTAGLELRLANTLGSRGRVLTFRQRLGGLPAAEGGLLNVVLRRNQGRWNVTYVASTITPDTTLLGPVRLSAREALVRAAKNARLEVSFRDVSRIGQGRGWSLLDVAGPRGASAREADRLPDAKCGPDRRVRDDRHAPA